MGECDNSCGVSRSSSVNNYKVFWYGQYSIMLWKGASHKQSGFRLWKKKSSVIDSSVIDSARRLLATNGAIHVTWTHPTKTGSFFYIRILKVSKNIRVMLLTSLLLTLVLDTLYPVCHNQFVHFAKQQFGGSTLHERSWWNNTMAIQGIPNFLLTDQVGKATGSKLHERSSRELKQQSWQQVDRTSI